MSSKRHILCDFVTIQQSEKRIHMVRYRKKLMLKCDTRFIKHTLRKCHLVSFSNPISAHLKIAAVQGEANVVATFTFNTTI